MTRPNLGSGYISPLAWRGKSHALCRHSRQARKFPGLSQALGALLRGGKVVRGRPNLLLRGQAFFFRGNPPPPHAGLCCVYLGRWGGWRGGGGQWAVKGQGGEGEERRGECLALSYQASDSAAVFDHALHCGFLREYTTRLFLWTAKLRQGDQLEVALGGASFEPQTTLPSSPAPPKLPPTSHRCPCARTAELARYQVLSGFVSPLGGFPFSPLLCLLPLRFFLFRLHVVGSPVHQTHRRTPPAVPHSSFLPRAR
ncbi:hypothetical protein GQ53DRAFT_228187 [Thozetella sp. PMI_491]|nr:hypothetical protein GQ53DRAFT_228187 [Thozetella sp. PMI_491]